MNLVVLGHRGFIGQHVFEHLKKAYPDALIIGLSSDEVDLTTKSGAADLSRYLNPDTVLVMCAAIKKQLGDSLGIFKENLQIVENLCFNLLQNPIRQLIYFSSAAVYGEDVHNVNISENTPITPRSYYGISKVTAENLLTKVFQDNQNGTLSIVRPPLIYGLGDMSKGYGPAGFIDKMLKNEDITLWGDGCEKREFVYVVDMAKLVGLMVEQNFSGVLNPVSGTSHTFQDILTCLHQRIDTSSTITCNPRSKDKVDNVFCAKKLRQQFPSFSFTSLEQGLKEAITLIKRQGS
jgi:UDP-glucose 4-epimerase